MQLGVQPRNPPLGTPVSRIRPHWFCAGRQKEAALLRCAILVCLALAYIELRIHSFPDYVILIISVSQAIGGRNRLGNDPNCVVCTGC